MLAPLLARALEASGRFRAVTQAPGAVAADVRLDTELVRLRQDFGQRPSRVALALRVQLVDLATGRVSAAAELEEFEDAATEDAYGGVVAANRALQRILGRVADFCANASARR
jgi:cholesterol transport system auxiliary component